MDEVILSLSEEVMVEAIRAALAYAAENGVTRVQDMSASPEVFAVYQKLLANGELTVCAYGLQPLSEWERLTCRRQRLVRERRS